MTETRFAPPFEGQQFTSHQQWVNKASSWLTCHPEYRNTEHGEAKGWRGHHFTAMCFDSLGRRVRNGGDFRRAEEEGAFPVWWIWPDQIPELVSQIAELRADLFTAGQLCDRYATGGAA
ncbi:hypothetical protein CN200_16330 [Sinorhizobium meliloti]|uniref:hypothetical protein n=1 Tax=Rhizobium meliloti TaxID=382 RepID=UPI000FD3002B|nr:hypothetical protein [Sinorhizobium meliloti]RVI16113.1 hypothetical protein CN200_16330 [Sinorhizobium meliloti]RVN88459.1 hypothetical protein CN107_13935 [Sinorhizobium meliloti]RVO08679.1 hypothetical protein CN103_17020 [Sinorhizobium meliloti]